MRGYKGTSLIRWATFRALTESDFSRKIIAFDAFGKFPVKEVLNSDDMSFINGFESAGGDGLSTSEMLDIFSFKRLDQNLHFVEGNVMETVPQWLQSNPQGKIALLHLDMDVYEPTKFALENLWDRLVRGGLVIVDDYNAVGGATKAVDEFLEERGITLQKLGLSHVPSFFKKT